MAIYYAVAKGKQTGIYTTWAECKAQTHRVSKPVFKKFTTLDAANSFLAANGVHVADSSTTTIQTTLAEQPTIYTNFTVRSTSTPKVSINHESVMGSTAEPITTPSNASISHPLWVYTDGACIHNGQSNARAGIGVYFGEGDTRNVSQRATGKQSNNTAEVQAVLVACQLIRHELQNGQHAVIYTDSQYVIGSATTWGQKHAREGWHKDIPNKALVRELYNFFASTEQARLEYVRAHTGATDVHSHGNAEADVLAKAAVAQAAAHNSNNNAKSRTHFKSQNKEAPLRKYLNVPYTQKEKAKKLGCQWDAQRKQWYCVPRLEDFQNVLRTREPGRIQRLCVGLNHPTEETLSEIEAICACQRGW